MRPVPLLAAVAAALGTAPAFAAPPTTPADLRVDVYSGTAAELFWSRSSDPDGAVSGYEIRRDGQLVETRDGLSYFTDDLTDGRAFAFTVTAVDFDGERSAPASVSVVGGDRDGSVGAGGGRPPPPANLTSSVYSSSAAEVFWDRSDQPGLTYEVSVDGGSVTRTDGTSAFLSGLDGARGRGVDVVAIDANGQRSGAANVTLGGGSGGGGLNPPSGGGGSDVPAPSSLRAELYSGSAGEVFWDRVPGASLSYEVRLDGEAVATTTGTSYFVGNRPGLDGTSVEVVAIGPGGARSDASSTTLGSGGDPNPPTGGGGGGDDAPDAPSNLRGEVYSSNAGEVFWDRVSGTNLSYEVSLDGEAVTTTTGTSYFAGNRPGIDGTSVEVVAIGPDGARSDASSTTLGNGGGSSNPDPDPDPETDAPPAPANARIERYSSTALEVFWDRAPASANVTGTKISLNEVVLGSVEGNSAFYDDLPSGQEYVFELIAVNSDGVNSSVTTVSTASESDRTNAPISAEALPNVLAGLSEVIRRNASARVVDDVAELFLGYDETAPGRTVSDFSFFADENDVTVERAEIDCSAGGSYVYDEFGGSRASARMTIDGCVIDGVTYSGTLRASDRQTGSAVSYDGFTVDDEGRDVAIASGDAERFSFIGEPVTRETVEDLTYSIETPEGTVNVEDMTMTLQDDATDDPRTSLDVGFAVSAPWTDGQRLTVSTEETFADGDAGDGRYASGRLRVSDDEGDSILIDAGNGDPDTFDVTVSAQGSTTTEVLSWDSSPFALPCITVGSEVFAVATLDGCAAYPRLVAD